MTKPRVYVETTIPSFYHDARTTPDIVARREWTRLWWSDAGDRAKDAMKMIGAPARVPGELLQAGRMLGDFKRKTASSAPESSS